MPSLRRLSPRLASSATSGSERAAQTIELDVRMSTQRVTDVLGLMGDSVDNIPGVHKCGPKTAAKWLNAYGTLDAVMENAGESKGKGKR